MLRAGHAVRSESFGKKGREAQQMKAQGDRAGTRSVHPSGGPLRLLDFHRPEAGCLGPVEDSTGDIRKITVAGEALRRG